MWRKHRVFRLLTGPLIGLILLTTFSSAASLLLTQRKVSAADGDLSPTKKAQIWGAAMALYKCSVSPGWDKLQTAKDLNAGSLFHNNVSPTYFAGYLVDDDGGVSCTKPNEIKHLFTILDENPVEFLEKNKLYEANDNGTFDYVGGSNGEAANTILKAISGKLKLTISPTGILPESAQYPALIKAYNKECRGDEDTRNTGGSALVIEVDEKGNVIRPVKKYFYKEDANTSVAVGYGLNRSVNGEMTCGVVVAQLAKTYDKYAAAVAASLADTDPGNDEIPPGTNTPDPNENSNATCKASGPLEWILCPVYNMIAEATEFFYKQILQPFLYTPPVSTDPTNPSFKAWSGFRLYGNIILIIAMIVVVFGQSIGGGLIDAYTAKKILPRIVVAAILINISVYIVAVMVDLTNILGKGVSDLIMAPFGDKAFGLSASAQGGAVGLAALGLFLSAGALSGFVATIAGVGGIGVAASFIGFSVVLPAMLAIIGVFVTLVIRRGIILALVLVSPIAFALYCLPNTEQYFRKWWDLLFKSLLVYPIVMLIFAVSNVMSLTVMSANSSDGSGGLTTSGIAGIIAFAMQIIPLFMVPFAFKFAGGAMGSLYGAIQGGGEKARGLLKNRQEIAKTNYRNQSLQGRQRVYDALGDRSSKSGRLGKKGYNFLRNRVGGHDLYGALAAAQAERSKEMEATKDTGIDDELRGLTVNKRWAKRQGEMTRMVMDGKTYQSNGHVRVGENGKTEYRTLGGRWVSEAAVDAGHQRYKGDAMAAQWALGYEMQKATTQEEQDYLFNNFSRVGQSGGSVEGLNTGQLGGLWQGAAFSKQNTDRQWKHYKYDQDENGNARLQSDGVTLMREIDERQGTYAMSQQHADTWRTMREEYERAHATVTQNQAIIDGGGALTAEQQSQGALAQEVVQRAERIANSYSTQMPQAVGGQYGAGPDGQPITVPTQGQATGAPADTWVVSPTGAPAATQEEIGNFVSTVLRVAPRNAPGYTPQDNLPNREGGQRPSGRF